MFEQLCEWIQEIPMGSGEGKSKKKQSKMESILLILLFIIVVIVAICLACARARMGHGPAHYGQGQYMPAHYGQPVQVRHGGMEQVLGGDYYAEVEPIGSYSDYYDGSSEECTGGCDVVGGRGIARLGIREPWFSKMHAGEKKIEGRLRRGAAADLKAGDTIMVARSRPQGDTTEYPGVRRYETTVVRVTPYKSFADMVAKEGADKLFPGKKSDKEVLEIYRQHSSEADEAEVLKDSGHAVVAIEIAPVSATAAPRKRAEKA